MQVLTSETIKQDIIKRLGFFSPFFELAYPTPNVLQNLWQQTQSAYLDNPLPNLFKEKLAALISRYCAMPYCLLCHSSMLKPLGMKSKEVLTLLQQPALGFQELIDKTQCHDIQPLGDDEWPLSGSAVEECLLFCCVAVFLKYDADRCFEKLNFVLGRERYQYLLLFLGYNRMCLDWVEAHPQLVYDSEERAQKSIAPSPEEKDALIEVFQNYKSQMQAQEKERLVWLAEQNNVLFEQERLSKQAAQQSENQVRLLLNSTTEGIWGVDINGKINFVNTSALRLLRFESIDQMIGRNSHELVHHKRPDGSPYPQAECPINRAFQVGKPIRFDNEVLWRADGTCFYAECSSTPIVENGKITGAVVTFTDITEKRQFRDQAAALVANERENFRNLFRQTPEMVCILKGPEHIFEFANEAYMKMLGFDATGMTYQQAQPESTEAYGILDEVYRSGVTAELQEIPITLSNRVGYFNLTFSARRDDEGRIDGMMVLGAEVTEQVLVRETMKSQKQALEMALNDASLESVLLVLTKAIEEYSGPGVRASILVVDEEGERLLHGAAPSLPEAYNRAIHGLKIGPKAGSCGTAAYQGQPVNVTDTATSPLWDDLRDIAMEYGLKTCWSTPICSSSGKVLGTFAIYNLFVGEPRPEEQQIVDLMANTAALILERQTEIQRRLSAELALEHSEEQLSMAVNVAQVGFFDWDAKNDQLVLSGQMKKDWGIAPGTIDRTLEDTLVRVHIDEREKTRHLIMQAVQEHRSFNTECRVVQPSGSVIWVQIRGQVTCDENGRAKRVFGTSLNISEQKRNEESLRESEELFRLFAEVAPQMPFIADPDGKIIYFNQRWYDYMGLSPHQVQGWNWETHQIHHPDDKERTMRSWIESLTTGKPYQIEYRLRRHDGQYRWHLARALPIRDEQGQITRWYGTNVDIHDQKTLADELSMAVTAADLGFWDFSFAEERVSWSEQLRCHYGLPEGQYHGPISEVFARIHPDDRSLVQAAIEAAQTKRKRYHVEFRVVPAPGEIRWLECQGDVFFNAAGEAIRMSGTSLDISERKRSDEELRKAKDAAENASTVKSAFLANMSHEIRTPLGAILGFTELLKEGIHTDSERQQFLDIISRNGSALTRIIDDILDLSKVEAGFLQLETVDFSLADLVEEVMDLFRESSKSKDLYLKLNMSGQVPDRISSDPARLRQILINIIGNAVKFTSRGGIKIDVQCEERTNAPWQFQISIKDTGIGLRPEHLDKLFHPFTQADNSTARKFGGSGLGLALSKRLANAMGGDISVDGITAGEGCTFIVRFMANVVRSSQVLGNSLASGSSRVFDHGRLSGVKVLLAEDAIDNQILVRRILMKNGATVELASNGAVAIQKATHADFDLILMDLQMPGVDGYEATRTLRSAGYSRPIIALTAHAMLEERIKTRNAGCDGHLTKPLNMHELLTTIERFTGTFAASQGKVPPAEVPTAPLS